MWWLIIPGVIVLFLAIILIRAMRFKPALQTKAAPSPVEVDKQRAVDALAAMVRCKTISSRDESLVDIREFDKFKELLKELYPKVHQVCAPEYISKSGILYHLKGESSAKPSVFMSHYDVVTVEEEAWEKPAFEGIIEDGVLWGRGTLDTKITLCGVMEAAETLLEKGFVPKNDMYFAFSGDEETSGNSAPDMVAELERRGVRPALVLDEGGAVVAGVFPGVKEPCALIGTAEKGLIDLEFQMESKGGHASAPPPHTLVGELAKAAVSIEANPFRRDLSPAVAEMFDTLGRYSTFVYRLIFANLWCFMPLLDSICKKTGGELNALVRTTCALTRMQGSTATNVLPPTAMLGANLRISSGGTVDGVLERLKKVINNDSIKLKLIYGMNPSTCSETAGEGWEKLKSAIAATWPESIISPYLMVAASDSRHYHRISKNVYRFSVMELTKEERGIIHGHNERIPVEKIGTAVGFYLRLLREC